MPGVIRGYRALVDPADLPAYEDFHANRLANLSGVAAANSYVTMKPPTMDSASPV